MWSHLESINSFTYPSATLFNTMASLKMLQGLVFAILASQVLAIPADYHLELPQDDGISLYNFSALTYTADRPNCYKTTDDTFFSMMASPLYSIETCKSEWRSLYNSLQGFGKGDVSWWYTSDRVIPARMQPPALELPLLHESEKCSFAVVSPKMLSQFVEKYGIEWRREWGTRLPIETDVEVVRAKVNDVIQDKGLFLAMNCAATQMGVPAEAGHCSVGESVCLTPILVDSCERNYVY